MVGKVVFSRLSAEPRRHFHRSYIDARGAVPRYLVTHGRPDSSDRLCTTASLMSYPTGQIPLTTLSARNRFLDAAARSYAVDHPATSAHLMTQRNEDSNSLRRPLVRDSAITRCSACGTLVIPGVTSKTILRNAGPDRKVKRKNNLNRRGGETTEQEHKKDMLLIVECLRCHRHMRRPIDTPRQPRDKRYAAAEGIGKTSLPETSAKNAVEKLVKDNAQSKQRAKARKGGLQALLDKSKQDSSPSRGNLDLMDFMKQI